MSALEPYLSTLVALRGAAVPETSHYAALQTLLNDIGSALRPRVYALIHPKDSGAGIPDLGLYDDNQPTDQKPARGIVEAKPVSDDLLRIAQGEQVARYVAHYGQALVTNYYQFALITRDAQTGKPLMEERYDLAASAGAFWDAAKHPRALAQKHETALREYLLRVMRRSAPLSTPQDVAWILASYAREARARIAAGGADLAALNTIRGQFEASLGVRFEDETAEDFFRSTLVQTLFYGLFSAWVLWHEKHPGAGRFDLWRDTRRMNIPVISELFEQFSSGAVLPLSVEQILDWTADALNRVDRAAFFASFNTGAAVQYFYEPFLEAFDPELRRQLGVWYTPPEVVEYMVERVDAALKTELGIADGLADPSVYVLDPCCGTGAYLVAVLRHIYAGLRARDGEALAAQAVQQAMRERVFGFEILPAPFVVAHLQIGMLLNTLRAPLSQGQRAGVYLTNALSGWDAASAPKMQLMFPELRRERDAADTVKRGRPILVILGNPPYSGFAGVAIEEERTLTTAYRTTQNPALPRPQGQGLNDLYVRFYRMAERQIAETTQRGVVCFISNYSWLDGLSHTGMRERYLDAFDQIIIDNLNGDKYKTGKTTPEGKPDPSIFSTEFNREGIQVGTAIATLIRKPAHTGAQAIQFRHVWGTGKRAQLKADAASLAALSYEPITPALEIGLPYMPHTVGADYFTWPKLPDLFPVSFPGVKTSRDDVLVDVDRDRLDARMRQYFDPNISHDELRRIAPGFMTSSARYDAVAIRDKLRKRGYLPQNLVRYSYRPFDIRWLYWESETKLLDEKRPEYFPHVRPSNLFLFTTGRTRKNLIEAPIFTRLLNDLNLMDSGARGFPLYLYSTPQEAQLALFDAAPVPQSGRRANLSALAQAYLAEVASPRPSAQLGEGDGASPRPSPMLGEGDQSAADEGTRALQAAGERVQSAADEATLPPLQNLERMGEEGVSPLQNLERGRGEALNPAPSEAHVPSGRGEANTPHFGEGDGASPRPSPILGEGAQSAADEGVSPLQTLERGRGEALTPAPNEADVEKGLGGAKRYAAVYGTPGLWQKIKPFARQMRHEPTRAEAMLWKVLRDRQLGFKFRRQHPIDRFIVDFYCADAHLVIEVDGAIHDYTQEQDAVRQKFIESLGLRVLRFRNEQIYDDLPAVMNTIRTFLTLPPPPLPADDRDEAALHNLEAGASPRPSAQLGEGAGASPRPSPGFGEGAGASPRPSPGFGEGAGGEDLFYHTLAVLHSPAYRIENAGALRQDWPRVPLPRTWEALDASAALGRQVAALLDVETPVPGVTQGDPRPDLRSIGVLTSTGGAPDFTINVNWGYFGAGSAVMPGRGRVVEADGLIDIYLNATTYWQGIPQAVWEYTLGGYQVLKKWLSYRETAVLGRPLKAEEAREFMHIARRIAALLALSDALDVNYRAVVRASAPAV